MEPKAVATKPETELWWVSVGGNACEPARVVIEGATRTVYTIACPDGTVFSLDCGIELVEIMEPPPTPKEAEKQRRAWERKIRRDAKHGYRKF